MGGGTGELTGPDLREGLDLARLADGELLVGHADGEAVLLFRRGDDVFAVGGSCTHYGAPLAEGLVVGDTLRCPWHHACFSLKSGEALGAPALNPLPCWDVRVEGGRVQLGEKDERPPLHDFGRANEGPSSVVIVGGGAAGSAAAEMLRRLGYARPITMIDPEDDAPYDRPNLSKDYLAGSAPEEWIPLRSATFYPDNGIERVARPVASLDIAGSRVRLAGGVDIEYGALLLATGSTPVRLNVPGAEHAHVHTLRSLDDCRRIIAGAADAKNVVVVGASFIGMEVAAALRGRGLDVSIVAPDAVPFERVLGPDLGAHLKGLHEEEGVRFHLGRTVAEIMDGRVRLDDGSELAADLVVVGIGVRPNLELAEAAGLEVDRGVVVDRQLRSSAQNVYAAGDIASWPIAPGRRARVEHWQVAQRQGQAAARNIVGRNEPFTDVPFFWTRQYDTTVAYTGHAQQWDRAEIDGDPASGSCSVSYFERGEPMAMATIGRDRESLVFEAQRESETELAESSLIRGAE